VYDYLFLKKEMKLVRIICPLQYLGLGMEIAGNSRKKQFWDEVLKKNLKKSISWLLFLVDRICLTKSVLSFLPLYYIFVFKVPKSICKKIVKL